MIDVLIKNDKDPVEAYYQTAVEFCNKAVQEIDNYPMNHPINMKAGVRNGR